MAVVNVDKAQVMDLLEDMQLMVIDVRSSEEAEEDLLVEDAVNIEMDDNFEERIEMLPKERKYLVYSENGVRSQRAAKVMDEKGFASVYNLTGGLVEFSEEISC